jgi:DNA-binding transcriptional LysR family regulator
LRAVVDGEADFGISTPLEAHNDVQYEHLVNDQFVLICPNDDPIASRPKVNWSVFTERPFIASGEASSIRFLTDRVFAATGLSITPSYASANISVLGAMVSGGIGIAAVPRLALRLIDTSDLAILPLINPSASREIGILSRKNRSLSAAAVSFRDTVRHQIAEWPAGNSQRTRDRRLSTRSKKGFRD